MKLIKFASAALAASMAFSAAPVLAADESSSNTDVSPAPYDIYVPVVKENNPNEYEGKFLDVFGVQIEDKETLELIKDEKKVAEIIENAGYSIPKEAKVIFVGAGDYKAYDGPWSEVDFKDVMEITYVTEDFYHHKMNVKNGDTLYVLHQTKDGKWEVIETTVEDGVFSIKVDGLSPIAFYKIEKDGKVIKLTKEEAKKEQAAYRATVKKSPNTGI